MWRGRYTPLETIAQGGQGRVVRGVDRQHDRPVALKIRRVASVEQRNQVLAEARVLLSLRPHPGLPTVREDFFEGDSYVLVMDWVEGTSLDQVVAARGAPGMPLPSVLRWAAQLAAAIDHLHAHRPIIVHGDVKPANAVLTPDDRVVLVDFGIATSGGTTRSGTAGYTAPEVLDGRAPTPAADVYGLAATALSLLTGRPPGDVRPPWDGIDPATVEVIERALRPGLSLEPERRPASARELVERMHAWSGESTRAPLEYPQPASTVRRWARPASALRRPRALLGAVPAWLRIAGVIALIGGVVAALLLGGTTRSPVRRAQGADRYATAAQVALNTFTHADVAVLARGDDLSDAIAASYVAGAQGGGPILLTPPQALPTEVLQALQRLKVKQVFVIGDNTAIDSTVDAALQQHGMRTTRLAGVSRYETAGVIEQAGGRPAKLAGFGPTAVLVNDSDLADAVAAGPLAFRTRFPLLYTGSGTIPAATLATLREDGITHLLVIGPESQVTASVLAQLTTLGVSVQRISGAGDAASDSIAIAQFEQQTLHWPRQQVVLVRGDQGGIDGVAAIAAAGRNAGALLLTNTPDKLGTALQAFLVAQAGEVRELVIVGDLTTITAGAEREAATALQLRQ
jgi:putative cell wall-binding protein/tRNA A-37 threonylcarbamoyl transferase component Bud32